MDINCSWDMAKAVRDLLCNHIILRVILARQLNVNRRRLSEIENLAHDVRRLKEELGSWKLFRQILPQAMHVLFCWTMTWRQRHQNFCVRSTDSSPVAVGKIDA